MEPLRILLVGNGGREHALAWKLCQSPLVESILAVPGNGGTATVCISKALTVLSNPWLQIVPTFKSIYLAGFRLPHSQSLMPVGQSLILNAQCPKVSNNDTVKADDYPGLVALAQKHNITLVVPGPEAPLVDGIEGYFRAGELLYCMIVEQWSRVLHALSPLIRLDQSST